MDSKTDKSRRRLLGLPRAHSRQKMQLRTVSLYSRPRIIDTNTKEHQPHPPSTKGQQSNPLVDLPLELVLTIAGYLDKESQNLLAFSCRRFYVALHSKLDLTLENKDAKLRFLRVLENDYPRYLTCPFCVVMNPWAKRVGRPFECLHVERHTFLDYIVSKPSFLKKLYMDVAITPRVVDLILRAYDLGPKYGLPVTYLNSTIRHKGIHLAMPVSQSNEARVVDGQLVLYSRMAAKALDTWLQPSQFRDFVYPTQTSNVCLHFTQQIQNEIRSGIKTSQEYFKELWFLCTIVVEGPSVDVLLKCRWCETDYRLHLIIGETPEEEDWLIFEVWRNYGRRYDDRVAVKQMFHQALLVKPEQEELTRRNVQAIFESQPASRPRRRIFWVGQQFRRG
ncbi:uncharacterized protein Z520_11716 [Fonsecaea multimorphosa CBS 102226]|uniref:F-box domain-containing protein n=1 Tax=Fonsecaea multimorphosa CBS 102226 TaxID=1442371 RepID=A0A0D2GSU3_9EURO|nr:uncharacterized protein Z520_11716 [Fonsecaea multimorphosa CBS 102226]KIX92540.1 hypothetical protein Z520_11716 [Fonsecaea multimorphosa CBS 102226]OAL17340.1 hypothetical protein AYO22_11707 [Fonsecaea multimorphosa]